MHLDGAKLVLNNWIGDLGSGFSLYRLSILLSIYFGFGDGLGHPLLITAKCELLISV